MNTNRTDNWICNCSSVNLPYIKELIYRSNVWKNRKSGYYGSPESSAGGMDISKGRKPKLYIHGRNPNRKQFRELYTGSSGTCTIRKDHSTYFGVYCEDSYIVQDLQQLILEQGLVLFNNLLIEF